jgi:HK97 family phage major capsid protein
MSFPYRNESQWIPIEMDSGVITRIVQTSAIEFLSRRVNMGTNARAVPRSGGVGSSVTARGQAYTNDDSTDDEVTLQASKFAQGVPLTDEDLSDLAGIIDVISTRGADWAGSYAIHLDNACLGATGVGVRETPIPFTSLYQALTTADAGANYTANANVSVTATLAGTAGYNTIMEAFATYEESRFFSPDRSVVIAHPRFKRLLRTCTDNLGRPLFEDSAGETTVTGYQDEASSRTVVQVLDTPAFWSLGSMTAGAGGVPSNAPTGYPLMFIGNRDHSILGIRSGPETKQERLPGQDVIELMYRSRRGFHCGFPQAWSCLVYTGT